MATAPTLRVALVAAAALVAVLAGGSAASAAAVDQVDPLIGTARGNTFPGAARPFGLATPSPDTEGSSTAGYTHGRPIVGFSQVHVSGTGVPGKFGNFRFVPLLAQTTNTSFQPQEERASPGYYSVRLAETGIRAELTAARMATFQRFEYPRVAGARLVADVSALIGSGLYAQQVVKAHARLTGPRSFEGWVQVAGGWGLSQYRLHFASSVDRPVSLALVRDGSARRSRAVTGGRGSSVRIVGTFDAVARPVLNVKTGLSFTSPRLARRQLSRVRRVSFQSARRQSERRWSSALGAIEVSGASAAERTTFATALYHAQLMPHDVTGDGDWPKGLPHFENVFTLWDTFRTVNPLLNLIAPRQSARIVQSLVATYKRTGWMPDARIAGDNGLTQVGSNSDVVVADAMVKGVKGIDYRTAYRAMRKNADVDSRRPLVQGRVLRDYRARGYVPLEVDRSASRTMEYAYDDFAVAQVARRLGDMRRYKTDLRRAGNWRNLWDPAVQSIRPRHRDGRFMAGFDPALAFMGGPFYEGSGLGYSTFVPHDFAGLIGLLGGDQAAVAWLTRFMETSYDPANEPALLAPYMFIHAGRPDLTQRYVRQLMAAWYRATPDGLPGDDDAGTLSAWYVFNAIGLYPNAGQDHYYVTTPLFAATKIRVGAGKVFRIVTNGLAPGNVYIVGATLNGRPLDRAFLYHREIARGGTLELQLGSIANGWGAARRPFSLSSN